MEEEIVALKTENEEKAQQILKQQDEITELNLLLDKKDKKIDNIQSMEDTTGIDITQHPEFKKIQIELAAVMEDLKKKDE